MLAIEDWVVLARRPGGMVEGKCLSVLTPLKAKSSGRESYVASIVIRRPGALLVLNCGRICFSGRHNRLAMSVREGE